MSYQVKDNTYGIAAFQTELLDILRQFISICEERGLKWWAVGGTCIGALRHQGFIPWDDDLDVAMPRPDYERLWALRDEINRNGRFLLVRTGETRNYHHRVMQLVDLRTTFVHQRCADEDIEHGAYIDILPMDAFASNPVRRGVQSLNAILFSIYNVQCIPEYNESKAVRCMVNLALKLIPNRKTRYRIWKSCERRMVTEDWDRAEKVGFLCSTLKIIFHPYQGAWFRDVKKARFEDMEINLPIGAEAYLTQQYGDFMRLPPEASRHPVHNVAFVDLETPYPAYKGIYYCVDRSRKERKQ